MVKLRYKSLVVNFLIGVSGIAIGYCICSNLNAVPLLQSQNARIAHEFYFGLNALCLLDQVDSSNFNKDEILAETEQLYTTLQLCDPYVAFPIVYGEQLSNDEILSLKNYFISIIDLLKSNDDTMPEEQKEYLKTVSSTVEQALTAQTPLKTLCTLIEDQ